MRLGRWILFLCRQEPYVSDQSERIPDLNGFCRAFVVVGELLLLLRTLPSNGRP